MSGIGESIAVQLVSDIVIKTAVLGYHIIRNTGKYAEEAHKYNLRLELQVPIIAAIDAKFQDKQFRAKARTAALETFARVMKEIHLLLKKYISCHCRDGPEKKELLEQNSADDLFNRLEAKEVFTKLSKKEAVTNVWSLLNMKRQAAWVVFKKSHTEEWVTEIEFWCKQLDLFASRVIPGMFPNATSSEIHNHVGDRRLPATNAKSRIMIARRTDSVNSASSTATGNGLQLMDIDDPLDDVPVQLNCDDIKLINENYVRSPSPEQTEDSIDRTLDWAKRSELGGVDRRQWAWYTDPVKGTRIPVIVEFKSNLTKDDFRYTQTDVVHGEIDKLIKTLRIAGNKPQTFHVMDCEGWYKSFNHIGLVYRLPPIPQNFHCESLGNILLKPEYRDLLQRDLDHRLQLAKALAWTVYEIHTVDWVHQSICPDNILLFGEELPCGVVRFDWSNPYVVGFDSSRSNKGVSGKLNFRGEWATRLYTHPDRLLDEYARYQKIHDIYSLGVVLLELGRMASFMEDGQAENLIKSSPHEVKKAFIAKAKSLQPVLGRCYYEVVKACLLGQFDGVDEYDFMSEFRSQVSEKLDQIRLS